MDQTTAPRCMDNAGTYEVAPAGDGIAALFHLSPDVIVVAGFDGIIRRVNPAAVAVSGYTEQELVGMDLRRIICPEDLARVEASMLQIALHGRDDLLEARGVTRAGEVKWYEWNGARIDADTFISCGRDISVRKRAELTLAMAGDAMGDMAQGYWVRDELANTAYWSPEIAHLFGLDRDARETGFDDFFRRVHPEDRARVAAEIAAAHADPACDHLITRYRIIHPDGTERTLKVCARFRRDAQGRYIHTVGTAQDVTEQATLQASLRREQDLTAAIFDTTGAIVVVLGRDGSIVRFNRAAEQLTGWKRHELTGKVWDVLIPESERGRVQAVFHDLRAGMFPSTHTNTWLTRDGREVPITWSNTAVVDAQGEVEYIIATGIDISGLQQMHQELQVARRSYRRLLEMTFDMVVTYTPEGTVLDINGAGARLLGVASPEEALGLHLRDLVPAEAGETALAHLAETLRSGEKHLGIEGHLVTRDGRLRQVEVAAMIATSWRGAPAVQVVLRDITERKLAQAALRAREDYFESLAQVAPIGIFQLDLDGRVVYANRRCEEILGGARLVGTTWDDHVDTADRPRAAEAWHKALRERRPFSLEFRHLSPDGEELWLRCKSIMEHDATGCLAGYIGTLADITPFKVLTEQLLEAEQRARRIVELSFDIIMLVEGEHLLVIDVNYPGVKLLRGTNAADFLRRPVTDFFRPADHDAISDCIRTALGTWSASGMRECTLLRADGTLLEVEGAAIPVTFQGEPAVYVVYRDITARKAAEMALNRREHHLATLARAAPVGIFQTDVHGQCNFANQRYLEITGYAFSELQGGGWWELVVPEDRELVRAHWQYVVEHSGEFDLEFRLRRKDGLVIWVLGQAVPERDEAGEVLGFIGSVTDVNQAKLDELELRNYREHLEEMVRERTLELEAVNRELESFSYSVSHDLRAPLRAINGFNSALMDEYGDKLDDQARFFLRRMQANTRQMAQLIDDMMQLSKVSQAELRREWVDLSAMAQAILGEMQSAEPARRVEIAIAPQLRAYGDAQLLGILMQNLLGNAWKYTGRNAGAALIEFGAVDAGATRAFYVRDNGVGFDMSCASHLFRAFQRLHDASEFEGTGIGLATVHRVVARHGGRVWAEGEEGKGATFFFTL